MKLDRKTQYKLLGGAVFMLGVIVFYVVTRPLPELELNVQEIVVAQEESKEGVFSITNLQTNRSVYRLDDREDKGIDDPKKMMYFTWDHTGDLFALVNPHLAFSIINEEGDEVINYLYGDYSAVPLDYGEGSANVPGLCSENPVDSCQYSEDLDLTAHYRVKAVVMDCDAYGDNPMICASGEQEEIAVTYSNWFQFEI